MPGEHPPSLRPFRTEQKVTQIGSLNHHTHFTDEGGEAHRVLLLAQVLQVEAAEAGLRFASYSPSAPLQGAGGIRREPHSLVACAHHRGFCVFFRNRHAQGMSDSLPETTLTEKSHGWKRDTDVRLVGFVGETVPPPPGKAPMSRVSSRVFTQSMA